MWNLKNNVSEQFVSASGKLILPPGTDFLYIGPHGPAEGKHCLFGDGGAGGVQLSSSTEEQTRLSSQWAKLHL